MVHRYNSRNAPETTVVTIASHLLRSRIIPRMPSTREAGNETTISNPARARTGLPHPGRRTISNAIVAAAIASRIADILP